MADKLAKYGTFLSANQRLAPAYLPNDPVLNPDDLFSSSVYYPEEDAQAFDAN
jgi:hypothetical protein